PLTKATWLLERHPHLHHGTEHRKQKWRQWREGQRKVQQYPTVPSKLEVPVPVLANADQEPFPELSLLLLQTRQTTQCVAAEQLWIRQNP
ncbi:hypothetical protein, partial [Thiolapillus sp.]|uniref:hypothetical protein n=1 Tax=Thiolapillus sp. TaxID=2017437 RepID=UPI003AF5FAB0